MKNQKKPLNEYDHVKKMLNTVRKVVIEQQGFDTPYGTVGIERGSDQTQEFKLTTGMVVIHGDNHHTINLSDQERTAFQESCDGFKQSVTDLVQFNALHIYPDDVKWTGKLMKFDVEFHYVVGDKNGVFLKGDMIKIEDDFVDVITKLSTYYKNFASQWAKVLSDKGSTKNTNNGLI